MLGHLVSTSRETPPDFGVVALLRKTMSGLQPILAPVIDALRTHSRKAPHPH